MIFLVGIGEFMRTVRGKIQINCLIMKSLKTFQIIAGNLLLLVIDPFLWGQSNTSEISETKSLFNEWISTEKIESKESSDWDIEKESLSDLTELLVEELTTIETKLSEIEKQNNYGENERIKLNDQNELYKVAISPLGTEVSKLEAEIIEISSSLPDPLKDDLASFTNRISNLKYKENFSISQRLQAIVGALVKIDKFNNSIVLDEKLLSYESGRKKVLVLYFGLGIAYYSDEKAENSGYLLPDSKGWKQFPKAGLGKSILETISYYQKTAQKQATFVNLPFRTK